MEEQQHRELSDTAGWIDGWTLIPFGRNATLSHRYIYNSTALLAGRRISSLPFFFFLRISFGDDT